MSAFDRFRRTESYSHKHDVEIARLRAERDALLKALVVKAGGAGVLFIPDTLAFPDGYGHEALEQIAKETGMTVVCGPAEAIEQIEERP